MGGTPFWCVIRVTVGWDRTKNSPDVGNMEVSKNRGKTPKMDGENHGKPYFLMDDLGVKPTIFGNTQ